MALITAPAALGLILDSARRRESRYVCFANVHSVVTAGRDAALSRALEEADLALPDGAPVAWWAGRCAGVRQARITGTEVTLALCGQAEEEEEGIRVALVGGTEATLAALCAHLAKRFPGLNIAAAIAPPFRTLSPEEDAALTARINDSGAGLVFVGLGCPKQELWMAAHRGAVHGVMLGVGAAFDFLAGAVRRPPVWMQRAGLEWLGRLAAEPRRLWRRYLVTNSLFVWYCLREGRRALGQGPAE